MTRNILILGAGGRDFHVFNTCYREDPTVRVKAFLASQIPYLAGRTYPPELAGPHYPQGIPIHAEASLETIIQQEKVHEVVLAYSDISHLDVMHLASRVLAAGPDFILRGPEATMLKARIPVISVCAVRTGSGKSPATRYLCRLLLARGGRPVVIRHPMAYGDLAAQRVQRFDSIDALDRHHCTLEEREEYEPLVRLGLTVYAGVDYPAILREAEQEASLLVWDGGNNDFPFIRPDLEMVLVDPLRPGHEVAYHPGETNLRRAHVVLISKADAAPPEAVAEVRENVASVNPRAAVIETRLAIQVPDPDALQGKRVLVIEDGPTLTHGGMTYGVGIQAAKRFGAIPVDPRPHAKGSILDTLAQYPELEPLLPAVGYAPEQLRDLENSINATPCDAVLLATPADLTHVLRLKHPTVRVTYELEEAHPGTLDQVLARFLGEQASAKS